MSLSRSELPRASRRGRRYRRDRRAGDRPAAGAGRDPWEDALAGRMASRAPLAVQAAKNVVLRSLGRPLKELEGEPAACAVHIFKGEVCATDD